MTNLVQHSSIAQQQCELACTESSSKQHQISAQGQTSASFCPSERLNRLKTVHRVCDLTLKTKLYYLNPLELLNPG